MPFHWRPALTVTGLVLVGLVPIVFSTIYLFRSTDLIWFTEAISLMIGGVILIVLAATRNRYRRFPPRPPEPPT